MKKSFIHLIRAGYRFRTLWLLAALAVVCTAGETVSGGRWLLPVEPLPAGYYEDVAQVFEPFFTPILQPDGAVWMVSGRTDARFSLAKPVGTVRVFVVGGSVAALWQGRKEGLVRILADAWPVLRFEVVNCGVGGYDSSRERRVLAEVLGYRPDLVVLLSGNNQFRTRLSRWHYALFRVNRQLRRAGIFRRLEDRLFPGPPGVRPVAPHVRPRLCDFERDVRWMLQACRARGVAVLPVALPANLRDFAPDSTPQELLSPELMRARVLLDLRRLDAGVRLLSAVTGRVDAPAIAWFWLGRAFDGLGRDSEARAAYAQALERDRWARRAWPSLNAALRRLAAETDTGVVPLDAAFAAMASRGMPGVLQFRDNCHWNAGCYRVLSLLVARELWKNRTRYSFLSCMGSGIPPAPPSDSQPPPKTAEDLADTVEAPIRFLAANPGISGSESDVSLLEGLAREGLFGPPCRLSCRFSGARLPVGWLTRTDVGRADGLEWCWPAFMLLESQACLRAGHVQDARGWLARAVKMMPALKRSPSALYLRWMLSRTSADAARWRVRYNLAML